MVSSTHLMTSVYVTNISFAFQLTASYFDETGSEEIFQAIDDR